MLALVKDGVVHFIPLQAVHFKLIRTVQIILIYPVHLKVIWAVHLNRCNHQIPSDSVQRRLLSIKMAVFMDRVCKNRLLSTKRAVFVDGM